MTERRRAWIALGQAHLDATSVEKLLEEYGSPERILRLDSGTLQRLGVTESRASALARVDEDAIDAAMKWAEQPGNHLVTLGDENYPPLLTELSDRPLLLFVKGRIDALHLPMLAIVGSRNPTGGGIRNAREFSRFLAKSGFTVCSGLAQGIDTAAHQGALSVPADTVAVLGHGIDRVYPAANRDLAHRIAEQGALVSEYPLGTAPRREHFPARNRLISGLSLGVLVVEAAYRSGSLITARLAAEQGREVFALPGSIHNPLARGCHRLIRDGARLVESGADIIAELQPLVGHLHKFQEPEIDTPAEPLRRGRDYEKLLDALGHEPATADSIAESCGLTIGEVSSMLLILELEGEIEVLQGGRYSRLTTG